ncbi:MATE family efflux transporter [Prevotella aurantiaca]|jgi:MATE efflux family protein|uniref:MATE family efflux transporter n=1 Tax=Prevotella aurantiaca TaxID=596085 RepID=UPI00288939E0|nr:MATE family efflux transporter [Prevotella aurantiaca]
MGNKKATLELGQKPVGKLLAQYALPAIIAMTAASLYNIIDRVFIGQVVGKMAISGLAITFPFMNLAAAFGAAVGIGASTTISVKLGQKDYKSAENILGNTITLNLIIGLAFGGICLIFLDPILRFFGASDATLPYARDYMQVILAGNVFSHMYFGMNAILRAASKPRMAMFATIFTVIMNILFDIVFILWLHWGIKGAAFATIISQVIALCWQMKLFANKNELLHLKQGIYKLKSNLVKNIISIGISPFLMNACACIIVIFINNQLVKFGGDLAVGAYGVANSIAMIFIMFVIGLNQGMQPIAGYNYGAQKYDRMMQVVKLSIITATCIMFIGWSLAMFAPYYCVRLFTKDPELIQRSIKAISIIMMMYPFIGCQMVITNFFQCIGKVKVSIFLSLSRQLLFLLPLLVILPNFYNINGVWAAIPTSDFIAVVVSITIMTIYLRRLKKEQKEYKAI